MALAISEVRGIVERVCARQDVLDACARRDLGTVITVLNAHGADPGADRRPDRHQPGTAERVDDGASGSRGRSRRSQSFADGLGMPPAARQALGLAAEQPGSPGISLAHSQRAPDLDAGLEYPGTPAQAAGNVSVLWQADLADQGVLEHGLITPGAWNEASLRWLVDPAGSPGGDGDAPGGVRVGMGDVERFRDTVEMFRQLDDRFGGGHARESLIQYLQGDAIRLLRGRYPETVGSALLVRGRRGHPARGVDDVRQHAAQPAGAAVLHPGARPGPGGRGPAAGRGDPGRDEPSGHLHRPVPRGRQPGPGRQDRDHAGSPPRR